MRIVVLLSEAVIYIYSGEGPQWCLWDVYLLEGVLLSFTCTRAMVLPDDTRLRGRECGVCIGNRGLRGCSSIF